MRILIVGANSNYAIEKPFLKYLSQQKEVSSVELFAAQNYFLTYYNKGVANKILYRTGFSSILKKINVALKIKVAEFLPDIVFVFKGMEIYPATLRWIKNREINIVNYNPDNPFIFSGRGSGNKNVTQSIHLFDLHLTYNSEVKRKMEVDYKIPTKILPFGFDMEEVLFEKSKQQPEVIKVCFMGDPDKFRAGFLEQLARQGISLDVYGNGWRKFLQHKNITILAPAYGDEFWLTLRKYRVQLNLMRPHNPDTHNMRTFEVGGVGGIQLAPSTEDHKNYFTPEKEIFLYDGLEECLLQIKKILSLPKKDADQIRENARSRSIASGYSYADRSRQALDLIREIIV